MKKFLPDMPLWMFDTLLVVGITLVIIFGSLAVKAHIELLRYL